MTDTIPKPEGAVYTSIAAAVCAAMGQVQKVTRDGRNKHDGYNFASIDDFLALVNPICAANGLFVHMQETAREDFVRKGKFGDNEWMRQSFDLTLMHVSGQSLPPVTRTVEVLRNGAQAYGSAQSYALKQFWRALLLIPTGDKDDADYAPTDAGTITRQPRRADPPAPRPDPSPQDDPPPFDATGCKLRILKGIASRKTKQQLTEFWDDERADLAALKRFDAAMYAEVKAAFAKAGASAIDDLALQAPPADDLAGDHIQY